jgi:hypothetical protein
MFFRDSLKQLTDSPACHAEPKTPASPWVMFVVAVAAAILIPAQTVSAAGACSDTAQAAFNACKNEVKDDDWIGRGNCYNVSDTDEQTECLGDLAEETKEASGFCAEQRQARLDLCDELTTPPEVAGDMPYDPDFSPFVDPAGAPNPFFPLVEGCQRVYLAYEYDDDEPELVEQITVTVTDATKKIPEDLGEEDGPPDFQTDCVVVNDLVEEVLDGEIDDRRPLENTDDWYAQRQLNGDVIYCGEIARDYVYPEGDMPDDPAIPELFEIEGSFKWGRDGAKPGILIEADPMEGHVYRQEMALGDAEDAAEVVNANYVFDDGHAEDAYVPEDAEELVGDLCDGSRRCVVTRDFTPIEPDVEEFKFYAAGIGPILEFNAEDGSFALLETSSVECGEELPAP